MKYWAQAIWEHLSGFLWDAAACLIAVAITLVLGTIAVCALGAIMFFIATLIGIDGVLILMCVALGLTLLVGVIRWLIHVFKSVKYTKERLEEMDDV